MENKTNYTVFKVSPYNEIVLALFTQLPFDSFEEKDDSFEAYIDSSLLDNATLKEIESITSEYQVSFVKAELANQNWNETWESNFSPVEIGDFVRIRADFHPSVQDFQYEIVIQPKMAFGTGHHQTTSMMVQAMSEIDFKGKSVLDYGCGTGILAIIAEKLGANKLIAVDNEMPSFDNSIENAAKNNCSEIAVIHGILSDVPLEEYDVVLANINRNVLLDTADSLNLFLKTDGVLLMSGILIADYDMIISKYSGDLGFKLLNEYTKDNWMCLKFVK